MLLLALLLPPPPPRLRWLSLLCLLPIPILRFLLLLWPLPLPPFCLAVLLLNACMALLSCASASATAAGVRDVSARQLRPARARVPHANANGAASACVAA